MFEQVLSTFSRAVERQRVSSIAKESKQTQNRSGSTAEYVKRSIRRNEILRKKSRSEMSVWSCPQN